MNPSVRLLIQSSLRLLASWLCIASSTTLQAQNPILPDFYADPSARVFNGKLYIYPSHDAAGARDWKQMVDWHVFSTDDMVKWTDHGVAFSLKDITWAKEEAWAPDCIERDGKYYFYFPAGGQIGVAVSDSPTGPFKDALGEPLIKSKEAGIRYMIDPCIFIDDGQAYLYVGGGRQLGVVKLKEDMITRDGPIQILDMPKFYEGVWIHKRNGLYYASYPTRSEGKDSQANVMVYSIAMSPLGTWEYKGEILDNKSHNVHGSITEFKGQWYLFYHVEGPSHWERRVCVERLSYNEDGTIKPVEMSKSAIAADGAKTANSTSAPPPNPPPTMANVAYGEHEREVLDFWKAPSDKPTPLVLYMHGGAWMTGDKTHLPPVENYLKAGISVVSISYRYVSQARDAHVKPPVEWPMNDAKRALQFVRSKAAEWNINKERIALSGNSAGACTSLWLDFHDDMADPKSSDPVAHESTRPFCVAVDHAQTSLDPQQMTEWTPNSRYGHAAFGFSSPKDFAKNEENYKQFLAHREEYLTWIKEYSPYEQASAGDPPVYLFYNNQPALGQPQKDPTHTANFGVKLKEKLDKIGVECELVYPGAPDVKHASVEAYLIEKLKK